jgi:hypothetical protein
LSSRSSASELFLASLLRNFSRTLLTDSLFISAIANSFLDARYPRTIEG